jgi:23S rRNA (guanosine2251-2'-O)-methyltransferase
VVAGIALAEDEELIAGRRPVEEAFIARRPAKRLLVVPDRRSALEKLVLHATSLRIPVVEVEGGSLTSIAGFDGHQGVALVVEPRVWAGVDDVLARARERGEPTLVLVLDSLEDPQNVGTLLRSAEAAGVHGAIFPTHRQAPLTPAAVKASAGAVEHLALAPVDDLPQALADLHARGVRIAGADGDASLSARSADLRGPLAIVVGSEGKGLSAAVRRRVDTLVRIPMHGRIGSLNAAVAGSVLLYEATAQRDPSGTGRSMPPAMPPERIDVPESGPAVQESAQAEAPVAETPAEEKTKPAPKRSRGTAKAAAEAATPPAETEQIPAPRRTRTSTGAAPEPVAMSEPVPPAEGDLLPGEPPPEPGKRASRRTPKTPLDVPEDPSSV